MIPEENNITDPVINNLDEDQCIPEDIELFLAENGIKDITYTCSVKMYPLGGGGEPRWLPCTMKNEYPSREELGRRFGPGKYHMMFNWRSIDPTDNKRKQRGKELSFILGEEWGDLYDEYMAEKYIERRKKIKSIKERTELENALEGDEHKRTRSGLDELLESKMNLEKLGLNIGGNNNLPAKTENENMFLLMLKMSQHSSDMQMQMMMDNNKNSMALITALIANQNNNNGNNNPNKMMEMVLNMVTSTVDLKNALNPEKETTVDKVFNLMEGALPLILNLAQQKAHERIKNPIYNMAMNSPEMQEMKSDPQMQEAWIKKWDAVHGKENTDTILATVGMARPGQPIPTEAEEVLEKGPEEINVEDIE